MSWRHAVALPPLLLLLAASCEERRPPAGVRDAVGDPAAGARIIGRVACGVCHTIPGIRGARGLVGPTLRGFADRPFIGGVVPNDPVTLVRWLRDAPALAPDTLMPPQPLSEPEARDVAAYLYTLW